MGEPSLHPRWREGERGRPCPPGRSAAPGGVSGKERPHERRFPGAARTPQENVVRGKAGEELPGVLLHDPFLLLDAEQILQAQVLDASDRFEVPREGPLPPVRGDALRPVDPRTGAGAASRGRKAPASAARSVPVPVPWHLLIGPFGCAASEIDALKLREERRHPDEFLRERGQFLTKIRVERLQPPLRDRGDPVRAPAIAPAMDPVVSASPPGSRFSPRNPRRCPWRRRRRTPSGACPPRSRTIFHHTSRSGTPGTVRTNLPPPPALPRGAPRRPRWIIVPTDTHAASESGLWWVICACSTARRERSSSFPSV